MDAFVVKVDTKGKGKQRADDGEGNSAEWLKKLNDAQREAVTWSSKGGLQILAGPGSGKTRVLTCRVAYLIRQCHIKPEDLIVVTFTNKAANEMKARLVQLLGEKLASRITMMGTFHSVAVKYLRKYGKSIDLQSNFIIADQSDCQSILKPILAQHNAGLREKSKEAGSSSSEEIKIKVAQDIISKSKAKGISPEMYLANAEQEDFQNPWKLKMGEIYTDYQLAVRSSNTMDFDDLLVFCQKLFQRNANCVRNVAHVLVDEFQDTNTIQYDIVKLMARASQSLTIVGDPDQSIYAWRSAEVENLSFMLNDFKGTHQVFLEENYRSTSSILTAALAVVQQDKERIQKSLRTSHAAGAPVVLRSFSTAPDEAAYIAYEVKRTIAQSGNTLNFDDFAVLLRYNALSRSIEAAFQSAGIPSRMIGGHKFFDRVEIKDVIAYLQLAENPYYTPAFTRVVNVPKRGIGDKTVKDILAAAKERNASCFEVVTQAVMTTKSAIIKPAQRTSLKQFLKTILSVRQQALQGRPVKELIDTVVNGVDYTAHLERCYGLEHQTRLENINELKTFAEQVASKTELDDPPTSPSEAARSDIITILDDDEEEVGASALGDLAEDNPLRNFLASSMLATDTESQEGKDEKATPKVTISTCHAAKGLEWPVVFVPAAETGVYPAFQKSDPAEVAEERRLLYVAMTRAQGILHLTHCERRMERGNTEDKQLTEYLRPVVTGNIVQFSQDSIRFSEDVRHALAAVTHRDAADESAIKAIVDAFHAETPSPVYSLPDDRFGSQLPLSHPQMSGYGKPTYPGQQWRMNSYAGDDVRRYASSMPNRGSNPYASAFSTAQGPGFASAMNGRSISSMATSRPNAAQLAQAPGFSSALSISQSAPSPAMQNPSASFQTVRRNDSRPAFGSGLNKPFRPPTMSRPSSVGHSQVATIETRLTQQHQGVILKPIAPKSPSSSSFSMHTNPEDSFSFLKGLAKEEGNEMAPARPSKSPVLKKRNSSATPAPAYKRSKS